MVELPAVLCMQADMQVDVMQVKVRSCIWRYAEQGSVLKWMTVRCSITVYMHRDANYYLDHNGGPCLIMYLRMSYVFIYCVHTSGLASWLESGI